MVLGAGVDEDELVAQRFGPGHRGAEPEGGVGVVVGGQQVGDGLRVVEERLDVGSGEAGGYEPEGGQRGVATADVRVGVDDAVAGLPSLGVERATRVGDDDDVSRRVEAGVPEGPLERPTLAVGLDGGAGLARDDDDRGGEVGDGPPDDVGVGGVEDDEGHARRRADDLGSEGGPAHAAEDDARQPLAAQLRRAGR